MIDNHQPPLPIRPPTGKIGLERKIELVEASYAWNFRTGDKEKILRI